MISIDEEDYPDRVRPIIRRLFKAIQDEKLKETMEIEDEALEDLQTKECEIEEARDALQKAEEEKKRVFIRLALRMLKDKEPREAIIEETGLCEEEIRGFK